MGELQELIIRLFVLLLLMPCASCAANMPSSLNAGIAPPMVARTGGANIPKSKVFSA